MNALPKSRAEAMAIGANKYQRRKPCKRGHTGAQWVHGGCCECRKENQESERQLATLRTQAWRGRRYRELADDARHKAGITACVYRLSPIAIMRLYHRRQTCPVTGEVIIRPGATGAAGRQAALMLVDVSRGWVPGNVELVTMLAAKADGGLYGPNFA